MKINGTGCSLVDNLYSPVDFSSDRYNKWTADRGVKDGLITGGLIFGDDLEVSSGKFYNTILDEITGGKLVPVKNVGGPAIVAMIHMAQLLSGSGHEISFYGSRGNDPDGKFITGSLEGMDIDITAYIKTEGRTPFTDVLSDPSYNNCNGERTFINYIGAAADISGKELHDSFFEADILIFGGTGLTPRIHDDLSFLLKKGREGGCITCVNTVFDFRNHKKSPDKRWPLVDRDEDFSLIDVLIADNEEALKISGRSRKIEAAEFFINAGVKSVIITHGSEDIICSSDGSLFDESGTFTMPVSAEAGLKMRKASAVEADTTGCGDNFAGGIYASLVEQLSALEKSGKPSLKKAVALATVSGGFAGLYKGGVYYEKSPGEKLGLLKPLLEAYRRQTGEDDE